MMINVPDGPEEEVIRLGMQTGNGTFAGFSLVHCVRNPTQLSWTDLDRIGDSDWISLA